MPLPYPPGEPLTCRQIREVDVLAIEHLGVHGLILMENAARRVAEVIYDALLNPPYEPVVILAGPGNNGGDGFVVARHLHNAGVPVTVILACPSDKPHGDAGTNLAILQRMDLPILVCPEQLTNEADAAVRGAAVIVDALLGTGATGAPRGIMGHLVTCANDAPARRVAIDIPSGLNGDSGEVSEPCFVADCTVTFVAEKVGFRPDAARERLGRIVVADIGVPRDIIPGRTNLPKS